MIDNNYSSLSVFRLNQRDTENSALELWNPESDSVHVIPAEKFFDLSAVKEFINTINVNIRNDSEKQKINDGYIHWLKMGWNKSLDYYTASRAFSSNMQTHNLQNTDVENFNHNNKHTAMELGQQYNLAQTLLRRRTKRVFQKKALSKQVFFNGMANTVLLTAEDDLDGFAVYFIVYNVENISAGVYSFDLESNSLSLIREGLFSNEMSANLQGMRAPKTASFTIILVANFEKLLRLMPYAKGLRDTYIESGKFAQKLLISYGQYDVFCLPTPALSDRAVSRLLKLDEPDYAPLYSLTFGYSL